MLQKVFSLILSVALIVSVFIVILRFSTDTPSIAYVKDTTANNDPISRLLGRENLFLNDRRDKWQDKDEYKERHGSKRSNRHGPKWEDNDWYIGKRHHKMNQKGGRYIGHIDNNDRKHRDKYDDYDSRYHSKHDRDDYSHRRYDYLDDYMDDYVFDDDYFPRSKSGKKSGKKGDKKKSKTPYYGWRK
jgi:hypothetical protein